eukprot:7617760-Lingulodinium_polyedra.AAC.1
MKGTIGCYRFQSSAGDGQIDGIVHSLSNTTAKMPAQCGNVTVEDCGQKVVINFNWSCTEATLSHIIDGDVMTVGLAKRFSKDFAACLLHCACKARLVQPSVQQLLIEIQGAAAVHSIQCSTTTH